jgi:DNA-binding GntR family transcriptional regulator
VSTTNGAGTASSQVTSERVADYLREAILSGEIGPGARIRQDDIAARLGSSRIPVREALRMLEAEGLTEHSPNKGARVPVLDLHEVNVLYQMRERLEPLALAEGLALLTEGHIDAMAAIQDEIEADTGLLRFLALDREFHLTSYSTCPSEALLSATVRLWNSTQHCRRTFMSIAGHERAWIVNAEHRLLLDALRRRDSVDAERFLAGHIRRTRVELARHPELFGPTSPE